MNKNVRSVGVYLTLAGGIIAAVSMFLYTKVMYRLSIVNYFLIGAIVLAVLAVILAGVVPVIANLIPVAGAALMASAAVWGTNLMVNQIGYVYAGLDGMNTITGWIIFLVACLIGMILNVVAAFLPSAKTA